MASLAKGEWDTTAKARLDELENVHSAAHGTNRGRRWGTEQINRRPTQTGIVGGGGDGRR